jgi:hypothetical protein
MLMMMTTNSTNLCPRSPNKQINNTYGVGLEASNETPLVIAAGDGVDDTDKSIWLLLPPSNDVEEVDISSLSLIASSANLAKSKRFC